MEKHYLKDIKRFLSPNVEVLGERESAYFCNVRAVDYVEEETLDWINPSRKNKQLIFEKSKAMMIICDRSIIIDQTKLGKRCVIVEENPKLIFLRIANHFFVASPVAKIHPTAFIDPEAEVGENTYVGPFTYVGKSKIGNNTIVFGNCHIYDKVEIGNNVIIHAGTVIGADGFGYVRNEKNEFEKFPHVAGVTIGDNVEIGSNTSIDRGSLSNTIIRDGAKIDNLVHIAHNVVVGRHSAVIANAMIGGSTKIGDYSWIAPSASLREQLRIGNGVTIGVGAVVTKDVPDGETWTGVPAKQLSEFIELQKKLRKL